MTIERGRIRDAYDALGLSPDEWERTLRVTMHPDGVTIERLRPTADGKWLATGSDGEPIVDTFDLRLSPRSLRP